MVNPNYGWATYQAIMLDEEVSKECCGTQFTSSFIIVIKIELFSPVNIQFRSL